LLDAAEQAVKRARGARELREAQAVLLPALHGLSLEDTGRLIGRSRATVVRLRGRFKPGATHLEESARQWGGRRRQNMTPEEEAAFLAPFFEQAQGGGILVVAPIKAAYEKALERKVPDSTVYRLLARHGWRKIAPRPRHPKGDPQAREAWKKNSPQR
jgi:transposase